MSKQNTSSTGWRRDRGYIWAMVGSAVGFANLLGFGTQCYRYGGGAFLIPFTLAMLTLGIPMLILEAVVGQRTRRPLISAYQELAGPASRFFGWMAVIAVATIGAFYMVLTGWSVAYLCFSAADSIPHDTAQFFTQDILGATGSVTEFGRLSWPILLATLVVAVFTWQVLVKNVRDGIERWCSIFLPLLASMILLFAFVVSFLPGAWTGIAYYLTPDLSKLMDFHVWRDVFGQLFFSLSIGLGIVVGYSRHTKEDTDIRSAMIQVAFADFAISFIAGFVTFGCIGYMAFSQGRPFSEIVADASTFEIGYVIFPTIIQSFGGIAERLIGVLFFSSVFIAGVTGVFSIVESCAGNLQVEFKHSRPWAVSVTVAIMTIMAIPFCWGNGTALIDALVPAVLGDNMLMGGIAQVALLFWMAPRVRSDVAWQSGGKRHPAYYSLRWLAVPLLSVILCASLWEALTQSFDANDYIRWTWFAAACVLSTVLARRRLA